MLNIKPRTMDAKMRIWRPPQEKEAEPLFYFTVNQGDMVRLVSANSVCVNDVDGVPCVSFGNATNVIVTISDKGDYELAYNWNRSLLTIPLCKVEFLSQMRKPNSIGDLIRSNVNGWEGLQQELAEALDKYSRGEVTADYAKNVIDRMEKHNREAEKRLSKLRGTKRNAKGINDDPA